MSPIETSSGTTTTFETKQEAERHAKNVNASGRYKRVEVIGSNREGWSLLFVYDIPTPEEVLGANQDGG